MVRPKDSVVRGQTGSSRLDWQWVKLQRCCFRLWEGLLWNGFTTWCTFGFEARLWKEKLTMLSVALFGCEQTRCPAQAPKDVLTPNYFCMKNFRGIRVFPSLLKKNGNQECAENNWRHAELKLRHAELKLRKGVLCRCIDVQRQGLWRNKQNFIVRSVKWNRNRGCDAISKILTMNQTTEM